MSGPALGQACPTPDELASFLRGDLPQPTFEAFADHLESCRECQASLAALPPSGDGLLSALRQVTLDDAPEERSWQADMSALEASSAEIFADTWREEEATESGPDMPDRLGEYRIISPIGRGGMGAVYKAVHVRLDKLVAIKVLPRERLSDAGAATRFQREMRAVGKLNHTNIVLATDAGEIDGSPFLVMEFVEGIDLARLIKRHGPVPVAEACELARQAALGLQYAHTNGLVHRDIKPSNLLLMDSADQPARGLVKVADLGLALLREVDDETAGAATSTNLLIGSLDYMAPEQASDAHRVDHRADLYSLGCTLYELLAGKPPFSVAGHQTRSQKIRAHGKSPVPSLSGACPQVPPALDALVARLLAKDPASRFATAAELAVALQPYCAGADLAGLLETSLEFTGAPARTRVAPPSRHKRTWAALLGCLAALLIASIVYIQTDQGTVEIESDDADVEVRIEQNGKLVSILDHKQNKQVRLRSGTYEAKLDQPDEDLELTAGGFTLKRGGKEVVKVRRATPPAAAWPFAADEAKSQQTRWAHYAQTTPRITNTVGMDLMLIPPGEFMMQPGYRVKLSKPYFLSAHEVTVKQFRQFVEATGYTSNLEAPDRGAVVVGAPEMVEVKGANWRTATPTGDDYPVIGISFNDAEQFCAWLSEREQKTYRVPTEAQWCWACRAGSGARYPSGDDPQTVDEFEWHNGNSGEQLHPVGKRKSNAWGLFDMNGNAVEWCRDWFIDPYPQGLVADPHGPAVGTFRVLRGGSFHDGPFPSTLRGAFGPQQSMTHIGFRVCRDP